MWNIIYKFASPQSFYQLSSRLLPWLSVLCGLTFAYGLIAGLFIAPADYQQGDSFRIMYIHVPCAFLSLSIYMLMAATSLIYLVWKIKLADVVAASSAPIGAWITFLALVSGSIWGKPTWGTWWIWDARLTSELILLFLYFGYIALRSAIVNRTVAARASAILALIGVVNIPVIHYSVVWWNTLHQGASLSLVKKPSIAPPMLYPLLAMIVAFMLYFAVILILRTRTEVLEREKNSQWVKNLVLNSRHQVLASYSLGLLPWQYPRVYKIN